MSTFDHRSPLFQALYIANRNPDRDAALEMLAEALVSFELTEISCEDAEG